jgi:site-specific DNA-methyltransferase (cytosine-N4-specific)
VIIRANSLARFPIADQSVQCVVTSPPYWALRDYGVEGQIGLEPEVDCLSWARREEPCVACFVCRLRQVFREVWRVLRDDGVCWVNLGDTYIGVGRGAQGDKSALEGSHHNQNASRFAGRPSFRRDKAKVSVDMHKASEGLKVKDLVGAPWRVAFALQADGWYLRQDVIWHKPCAMPESVTDRCTKAHEYLFILTKRRKYYWDAAANKEAVSGGAHARGTGVNPKASGGAGGRKGFPREAERKFFLGCPWVG